MMQAQIEYLVKLQALELERGRLLQMTKALPAEITRAEAALSGMQGQAAAASDALNREDSLRTKLEREIAGHRQKATRYKAQLDTVTTAVQATAIEHEVKFAEAEIERLENEEFASLERTEAQEVALAAARKKVEELAAALEKTREYVAGQQKEIAEQQNALAAERDAVRKEIERVADMRQLRAAAVLGLQHEPRSEDATARSSRGRNRQSDSEAAPGRGLEQLFGNSRLTPAQRI
jgi:uncharacterized protein